MPRSHRALARLPEVLGWIAFSLPLLVFGYAFSFAWSVHEFLGVSWMDVVAGAIVALSAALVGRWLVRLAAASLISSLGPNE